MKANLSHIKHRFTVMSGKGSSEKAARDLKVPFLGRIPIDPEIVIDCGRGMPFIMGHPNSEATRAFKEIAHRCKEYAGFKKEEKQSERGKFPHHLGRQEARQ